MRRAYSEANLQSSLQMAKCSKESSPEPQKGQGDCFWNLLSVHQALNKVLKKVSMTLGDTKEELALSLRVALSERSLLEKEGSPSTTHLLTFLVILFSG